MAENGGSEMAREEAPSTQGRPRAKARPTGLCWCGCRGETAEGRLFLPYHDRKAEAALVKVAYGSIADMLAHHGFGPENSVVEAAGRDGR